LLLLRLEPALTCIPMLGAFGDDMPMQVADIWLQQARFTPGQRMCFAFDYRNRCVTISPWLE